MSNIKKLMMSAAGGGALDVDDVFSTYLFTGNGTSQTITNGLDLAGEGGLIWTKRRDGSAAHQLYDTARGIDNVLNIVNNAGQYDYSGDITSVNSDGFSVGYYSGGLNYSNRDYATWSFRKAPKFFDVVTYTGNGVSGRTISHNLGTTVGMISIKRTDNQGGWWTLHRGSAGVLRLDSTAEAYNASSTAAYYGNGTTVITPTSTEFTVHSASEVNANNGTYVAYLWAHNDGDGEFGPDGDADIIKCGSYTGAGHSGVTLNLGFEPQFIMIKRTNSTALWTIIDNMRGMPSEGNSNVLYPNTSQAEAAPQSNAKVYPTPTGLYIEDDAAEINISGSTYVYMAIRRGPLAVPESATDVFAIDTGAGSGVPMFGSGFPVDVVMRALPYTSAHDKQLSSRLTGTGYGNVEASPWYTDSNMKWDYMDGYFSLDSNQSTWISWMWKRAPGFCDVVAYTGTGATPTVINHNLSATPEMMWIKSRTSNENWMVYHSALGNTKGLILNSPTNALTLSTWNNTSPNETTFTLGGGGNNGSMSGQDYIAYLFATLPGISKVGSYTGDGTINGSKLIDCGFSNGPALVIIKIYEGEDANHWHIFDTTRGLVAGNDSLLYLNRTVAAISSNDYIDPHNSGFIVGAASNTKNNTNVLGSKYIFYAIAA
jgi:hypothetical protein